MANNAPRPIIISIIAILEFIGGIFLVLAGIASIVGFSFLSELPQEIASFGMTMLGGGALIAGIICLIIAGGFWNGWSIMWYIGVIISVIEIILLIASIFTGGMGDLVFAVIIPVVVNLIILFYLFRPGVKEFFGI